MNSFRLVTLFALASTTRAFAGGVADEPPPPAEPTQPVRSTHVGITLGGAAIPGTDLSVAVAQLNLVLAVNKLELRASPIAYRATGENTSVGVGALLEVRHWVRDRYAMSAGSIVSIHMIGDHDPTLASGVVASPMILALGPTKQYELGLSAFLVYELEFKTVTPGAWISVGYQFH